MGKDPIGDDEIPLTHTRSNITYETRARFDSLLLAALDQEQDNTGHLQKNNDNVEEAGKFPRKQAKRSGVRTKPTDMDSPGRAFFKSVEGTASKSHNITTQELSSGVDFLLSSDDDVIMKRSLNGHLREHDKVSFEVNNDNNRELLTLDKRLKDERNSCQISQQKEAKTYSEISRGNEVDEIKINTRTTNIQSDSFEEYADFSQEKQVSPSCRNSKCVKKPVPLPRRKTQKEFPEPSKTYETEVDECYQQGVHISDSLSAQLPVDDVKHMALAADDDDCILSQNVERKEKKKKKIASCSVEEKEEIELRNIKTTSDIEVDQKEASSSRKSFHKSRRKSREETVETVLVAGKSQQMELSYDKVLGIIIHRSECLQVDPLIRHPLVKVHLLNSVTGNYLKKSNVTRPVSFYYENQEVDYILPLMTEIFDYKEKRSIVPVWEELLVFNEDFEYILRSNHPVLILFEVLDFVNFTVASSQYQKLGSEGGWHHIAWAFLKPVGVNGVLNTEEEVRLQLYKPKRMRKLGCNSCDVYEWWSAGVWERYPATLYVTVKGIMPPEHLPAVLRSRSALQGELSQSSPSLELDQNHREGDVRSDREKSVVSSPQLLQSADTSLPTWSRLPSQSCKIPNRRKLFLPTATRGCFTVKFSNSGLYLACSMSADEQYVIIVYSVPDGKEFAQFVGHQGLVYDLHWSPKDTLLLSASADCTACVWDTGGEKSYLLQMLPHPSFVYCSQFHPSNGSVLVTGCYDHVVRVWNRPHRSSKFELVQELEGHTGFVTAMSMSCNGMLYSGDSVGRVLEWTVSKVKSKECCKWKLNRNIDIRELRDTVVNRLQVHPGGQRLLVHARDSLLRMLDITTASVIQWFNGALNHRVQTSACLTPCGGLVLAASEDNTVHVWNADTGQQLAIYSGLQFYQGTSGVDYHPFEHMVAFASYGADAFIVVCDYDKLSSGKDIGLQMLVPQDATLEAVVGTESYMKSSTPLHCGISSLKEKKKNVSVNDSEMEVFSGSSLLAADTNESSLSPNSMNFASPVIQYDSGTSKARLTSIIEKMDHVLSKTHSKSSQKVSEIVGRSLIQKLNDSSPSKTGNLGQALNQKKKSESVLSVK